MVKAILELELIPPPKKSLSVLLDFINIWDGGLLSGGTCGIPVIISLHEKQFKSIFKMKPKRGRYKIPQNMSSFVKEIKVLGNVKMKEIIIE